ncbi:MAG: ATP-binding cassette domain-containing protein [Acidothermus cellulolyticus]|nr:ATP-binding cassette domain-containing protein [Acidothermus cellulolyticus]
MTLSASHVESSRTDPSAALRSVTVRFGKLTALDEVTLTFRPGITAVTGPNGGGKSTLLRVLATLHQPDAGDATVAGHPVTATAGLRTVRRILGYLPQEPTYFDHLRVDEALHYAGWLHGMHYRARAAAIASLAEKFSLTDLLPRKVALLSGGTRRRAYFAATLMHDPMFAVFDEPTSGVDPTRRVDIRNALRELAAGRTVIFSTQLTEDIELLADRVIVLSAGRVIFDGTPQELAALGTTERGARRIETALRSLLDREREESR